MDAEAIREIFRGLGPVQIRRMFGGQGIYRDELMFALVASGELYLKTDDESVAVLSRRRFAPLLLRDARREQDAHELLADARIGSRRSRGGGRAGTHGRGGSPAEGDW